MEWNQLREDLGRRFRVLLEEESFDLWDLEFASQAGASVVRILDSGLDVQPCHEIVEPTNRKSVV